MSQVTVGIKHKDGGANEIVADMALISAASYMNEDDLAVEVGFVGDVSVEAMMTAAQAMVTGVVTTALTDLNVEEFKEMFLVDFIGRLVEGINEGLERSNPSDPDKAHPDMPLSDADVTAIIHQLKGKHGL